MLFTKGATMSNMKCPICGTPLEYETGYDGDYSCAKCGRAKMFGSEELWQALTDSMKEHDLCHDALVERTKELDRTRKALDVAVDALKSAHDYYLNCVIREKQPQEINWYYTAMNMDNDIFKALEQITALEQKDK